jgi:two-component system, NarL family, sensor histidine kinase DesK
MRLSLSPKQLLYVSLSILYGLILLVIKPQEPAVFFLWIVSVTVIVVRIRFNFRTHFIAIDFLIYLGLIWVYDIGIYLILPSVLLLIYEGKMEVIFWYLLLWLGFAFLNLESLLIGFITFMSGTILYVWETDKNKTVKTVDNLREKVYTLEQEKEQLILSQDEISRVSILSERDRIAHKLHDDLGHELTGALLALRAYESNNESALDNASFSSLKKRLEKSVKSLKNTVHQTKPEEIYGIERFNNLIEQFNYVKVDYSKKGFIDILNATHWHALLSVLKEALTNVQKHATPTFLSIELLVDENIVRLSITNDGINEVKATSGFGLSYMRRRVEGLGGTLIIRKTYHFTLICVLPIRLEEGI